jgi:hypothetical protein
MRAVLLVLFCLAFTSPADVTVNDVKGLVSAAGALSPGKTILIAPGTYVLPRRLALSTGGTAAAPVVLAAAGAPGSVVIDANGAEEAFLVNGASYLRIEGLTITGGACHAIKVDPPSTDVVIVNNRMYDNTRTSRLTDQVSAVKGDPGAARVTVENNLVEQTVSFGGDNFQGIDCNAGVDWIVRGNTVRDIRGIGVSGSGIQFKSGSVGTVIENNLVVRCGLNGIVYGGFGNPAWGKQTFEHVGGVVRNNVVVGCTDAGITAINTCDGKVVNNTLFNNGFNPDVRRPTRNLEYRNNILDRPIQFRDGTTALQVNNVVLSKPADGGWFVNAEGLDLRLRSGAPVSPDVGATLTRKPQRKPPGGRSPKEDLRLGHEAMTRSDWSKAAQHFEAAAESADEEIAGDARATLAKIDRAGQSRLQEIQALEAIGEAADAIAAYQELAKEFGTLRAAQEARRRIEELRKPRRK